MSWQYYTREEKKNLIRDSSSLYYEHHSTSKKAHSSNVTAKHIVRALTQKQTKQNTMKGTSHA